MGVEGMRVHRLRDLARWQRWTAAAAIGSLVATGVTLLVHIHGAHLTPIGDEARQIHGALRAFVDWPLLGDINTAMLYGNPESHHPGPIAYYLEAPFVLAFGVQTGAALFAVTVQSTAIVLASWLAHRAAGFRAGLVMFVAAVGACYSALGSDFGSSHFQQIPVGPVFLCLVAAWGIARLDPAALVTFVLAASFVVQTETLYVPVVLIPGAVAVVLGVIAWRRGGRIRVRWLILAAAAGAVLWVPPLYDQVRQSGNLGLLASASIPGAGLSGGWHTVQDLGKQWLLLLIGGAVVLWRRPAGFGALWAVAAAAVVGGLITGAVTPVGDLSPLHVLWVKVLGWWLVGAVLVVAVDGLVVNRAVRIAGVAVAVFALVPRLVPMARPAVPTIANRGEMTAVLAVEPQIPAGPVDMWFRGGWAPGRVAQGLEPLLEADGHAVTSRGKRLVVTWGRTPAARGKVVATYQPHEVGDPAVFDRWVRRHGPLRLTADARFNLYRLVDGLAPTLCVSELVAHPDRLLDLSPDMAARLISLGWIDGPVPPDLTAAADRWQVSQRVEVRDVPVTAKPLWFSRSSCPA